MDENDGKQLDKLFKFYSAQSLWLGFMALNHDKKRGNNVVMASELARAYDDILSVLNRLYRLRRLLIDHIRVLHFYGRKGRAPRGWVHKEMRAHTLWQEALDILTPYWIDKGYLVSKTAQQWQKAKAEYDAMQQEAKDSNSLNHDVATVEALWTPYVKMTQNKTPYAEHKGY